MNNLKKKRKTKERWNARQNFPNKFHGDRQTENSQKISLFQIFLKIECSWVPIHFKVAAAGAAHPLRDQIFCYFLIENFSYSQSHDQDGVVGIEEPSI